MGVALEWERVDKKTATGEMVETQVRRVINDILEKVGESIIEIPTIRKWFKEWMEEKEASKTEKTAERYEAVVDAFIKHLDQRADKSLAALVPRDIQAFVAKRQKAGLSGTTANLDVKIIRSALNRARRQGIIQTNPAEAVDLPQKRSVERGVFNPTEVGMLVGAAENEWKTVVMFGFYTGARLGDCTKMEWEKVDLAKETIQFFETKTRKWNTVPIHPELLRHLSKIADVDRAQKYVTPHMAGLGPGGRHGLSEGFKRIVVKAGLDLQTVEGDGIRNISKRTFHALRHSFTSALANAGVAPELRMKLTGHKSAKVHGGYTHLEMDTLRTAIKKLPSPSDK